MVVQTEQQNDGQFGSNGFASNAGQAIFGCAPNGALFYAYFHFLGVAIAQGAIPLEALLKIVRYTWGPNIQSRVVGVKQKNGFQPSPTISWSQYAALPKTVASGLVATPAGGAGSEFSADIMPVVQELLGMPDWMSGDAMTLVVESVGNGPGALFRGDTANTNPANAAALTINV